MLRLYIVYSGQKKNEDLPEDEKTKDYIYAIDENGKPFSPSWFTLNFKSAFQLSKNLNISFGIENITDQRYRPYSSGIVSAGRNFIFSVKANY